MGVRHVTDGQPISGETSTGSEMSTVRPGEERMGSEREELELELSELDSTVAQLRGEDAGHSDELTHASQHPADVATELSDVERQDAALQVLVDKRERVAARLAELGAAVRAAPGGGAG